MKNIKSIIITLALTITLLLVSLLPTTQAKATTIEPDTIQLQLVNLKCCNIAYNKILDFNTYSNDTILSPQESANVDIYNTLIDTLEANGMNYSEIINYLTPNTYNR